MKATGREGVITYVEGAHAIDIPFEMSGSARYDLLLAPLDLRRWRVPAGEPIPHTQQKEILARLREWLDSRRTRTDIGIQSLEQSAQRCAWSGCDRAALATSAYCSEHFDDTLLRR
jgi:hypothetical protein